MAADVLSKSVLTDDKRELANKYVRFVYYLANMHYRFYRSHNINIDRDDIIQASFCGLIRAAYRCSEGREHTFKSYASHFVKLYVQREVSNFIAYRSKHTTVNQSEDDGKSVIDFRATTEDNNEVSDEFELVESLLATDVLNGREKFIVRSTIMNSESLNSISEKLNITKERVRQIKESAISKLRIYVGIQKPSDRFLQLNRHKTICSKWV